MSRSVASYPAPALVIHADSGRPRSGETPRAPRRWLEWLPLAIGLAVLYLPSWIGLARGLWQTDEQAHGPIVLAVALWLMWQKRSRLAAVLPQPRPVAGWTLLVFGLACYVLGRSQDILLFEVSSLIPVLAGVLLLYLGGAAVRLLWFPLFFLIFMVPIPEAILDALTSPLKQAVSFLAERLLYAAGYPVGRTGVMLTVGQYQLLVADACSGLNSMYSLSALGLLYLHLMGYVGFWRNALLIAAILPVAFVANVIRVMFLVLITYHFGDAAGQGFIHSFSGMVLFVIALLILMLLDSLLGMFFRRAKAGQGGPPPSRAWRQEAS